MIPGRDTAWAFGALPEVGELLVSAGPAWIWARDGSRILWANPAGGARLGAESLAELSARHWPEGHQLARAIASLARALPEGGTLARLRLQDDLLQLPVACRCLYVRAGAERGILVSALEADREAPSLARLAAFFAAPERGAVVLDADDGVLAESAPGLAEALTYASPQMAFADGGRTLRLCLVDLAPRPALRPSAAAPAGVPEPGAAPDPAPAAPPAEPPAPEKAEADVAPAPQDAQHDEPPADDRAVAPEQAENEAAPGRSVMAGRVERELSRTPVRFLWQTDSDDRYLFISPGLSQVVGRNAEVVGERWAEAAARLQLDPTGRIARALRQRDTWSGLTAWWPVEGSDVRVPVELTALPVFGGDQSFQGYRGFGVLRPAEALMPETFRVRFGSQAEPAEQRPPYEEAIDTAPANVVPIRADLEPLSEDQARLSPQERMAFEEIAAALRSRVAEISWDGKAASVRSEPERAEAPPSQTAEPMPLPAPAERLLVDLVPEDDARPEPEPMREPDPAPPADSRPMETREETAAPPMPAEARTLPPVRSASDAEQRLRELTAILDTATDGVVILDKDGRIESVNASAEALFALEAHAIEGRRFEDLLTTESRDLARDYLMGLRDNGVASLLNEGREIAVRAGAGSIPLFMTMGRISSGEGGRFCAVLRDITHWKRIETELTDAKRAAEEASKQKSEFLARVSHEIRTPLNAIIGFAEVMIEERFGPVNHERYREYLRDIRTSGEHVVSLVNDLLDISKIEAGKLDLSFDAVPLNELVRESIGLMQPQANRAHVVLRSSLSREVPGIVADERTMRQIVLNLLSNSVKYTAPGGQIIASTSLSETGEAILRVRDTGEGMSEEELARALEPFRQLATAAIGDASGSGLGLPLTKALVEANRASLSIKSKPGEGTVVTVTIPPTRVLSE